MSRNLAYLGQCFISCVYRGAQHLVKALKVLVELLNQSVKKFQQKLLLWVVLNHIESYMVCVCMCICVMVICACPWIILGFPGGASGKKPASQCRRYKRCRFEPWVGDIPWRRKWQPTPVFLPGESYAQSSLAGYSPWGHKELDTTEWLSTRAHNTYSETIE